MAGARWLGVVLLLAAGCGSKDEPAATDSTGRACGGTGTGTGGQPWTPDEPIQFCGPAPKNLLFISIDTLRKDHVGAYGTLGLTPYLDSLAAVGVVMDDHLQCSNWTIASGTCTLHGRFPADIGTMPSLVPLTPIPAGNPTLATALREAGFYTALATGNGYMSPNQGSATDYDEWSFPGPMGITVAQDGLDLLDAALANGRAGAGWFLHLHFMEPHESYNPDPQFILGLDDLPPWPNDLNAPGALLYERGQWAGYTDDQRQLLLAHLAVLYQAEVRMVDARIEWAMGQLESRGLLDDTLVVFWTDHGEQFFEHGYQSHAYELQYGENDAALFFWAKDIVPGRYAGPTSAVDLAPTVLDLLGLEVPPTMTGLPIGTAPPDRIRLADSMARVGVIQSAVKDSVKLHYRWNTGSLRMYDRAVDPLEQDDLWDPTDPRAIELWCAIAEMAGRLEPLIPDQSPVSAPPIACP